MGSKRLKKEVEADRAVVAQCVKDMDTIMDVGKKEEMSIQSKFARTRKEMSDSLIERDGEVDLILTALICQKNPLLVGAPGTAKSRLIRNLLGWFNGNKFELVMDKFTVPEQLFGPISVKGLKEDIYRRLTTGKLPQAHICFLDEIFKSSPSILNTLLPVMNERVFENGDGLQRPIPLLMLLSASNEWPQDPNELGAMFDRFLIRKKILPISSEEGEDRLLWSGENFTPKFTTATNITELHQATKEAADLEFDEEAKEAFNKIKTELNKEGMFPGDRRRLQSIGVCKAYAYLCGEPNYVHTEHLEMLCHALWTEPEDAQKCRSIVSRIANPINMMVNDLRGQAEDVMSKATPIPTEAITKLKDIQKKLQDLEYTDQVAKADNYLGRQIKKLMNQIIGVENTEEK